MWLLRNLPKPDSIFIRPSLYAVYGRFMERMGVFFYNEVISRTAIGLKDPRWSPKVHGVYCHFRCYGKADAKLLDVKMSELGAWLLQRDMTLKAMYNEFKRNLARISHLYLSPVYENVIKTFYRVVLSVSFVHWLIYIDYYKPRRFAKYHW